MCVSENNFIFSILQPKVFFFSVAHTQTYDKELWGF